MRLFTGIAIPREVQASLERLISRLRPHGHLTWSPPYNLHITTKFIGEWPPERLDELNAALREVPVAGELPIAVRGLGWFPNPHHPRVFWAAVHVDERLARLSVDTDRRLTTLGIEAETKPFKPHLTLARIRTEVPLTSIKEAVAALETVEFGQFTAAEFHLYRSEPGPAGTIYTSLAQFPLAA